MSKVTISIETLSVWRDEFVKIGETAEAEGDKGKANQYFVAASLMHKQIEQLSREYLPPAPWF